jgi:hypothetical protein
MKNAYRIFAGKSEGRDHSDFRETVEKCDLDAS